MWENLSLDRIVEYAGNPYPGIREWKADKGCKVIGSALTDLPEEAIYAFGFLPVTLSGPISLLRRPRVCSPTMPAPLPGAIWNSC